MILGNYGMEDKVGLYIYRTHPRLAAKINPKLNAGVKVYSDSNLQKTWASVKVDDYVINLAQTAMDETEKPNSAPAIPKAEKRTAPSEMEDKPPHSLKTRAEIEQNLLQALIQMKSTGDECTKHQECSDIPTDHPTAEAAALRSDSIMHTPSPQLPTEDTPKDFTAGEPDDMWWDLYDIHLQPFKGRLQK